MLYVSYIVSFLAIFFNVVVLSYGYSIVSDRKLDRSFKSIIICAVIAILLLILNLFFNVKFKVLIIFVMYLIAFKLIYKESFYDALLKTLILYMCLTVIDFIVSLLVMAFPFVRNVQGPYQLLISGVNTFCLNVVLWLVFKIKFVTNLLKSSWSHLGKRKHILSFIFICLVFMIFYMVTYYHFITASKTSFTITVFVLLVFCSLCANLFIQYSNYEKSKMEQSALLNLINDYEAIMEKDRINRHEMLNNLVVLKSFPNKNTKKYENILDDIIEQYQSKKSKNYASIYNLPSGIKGVVYYKIASINDQDINFDTLISKDSYKKIEELDEKRYYNVCKILGILLDNAIEASINTKDKQVFIDIYLEEGDIIIYIENSYKGFIDFDKINKKGYSTKGDNRGFGLSIVSKIVKNDEKLVFSQYTHKDKFISTLKIKDL